MPCSSTSRLPALLLLAPSSTLTNLSPRLPMRVRMPWSWGWSMISPVRTVCPPLPSSPSLQMPLRIYRLAPRAPLSGRPSPLLLLPLRALCWPPLSIMFCERSAQWGVLSSPKSTSPLGDLWFARGEARGGSCVGLLYGFLAGGDSELAIDGFDMGSYRVGAT